MADKFFIYLIIFIFIFSACSSATPQVDSTVTATVSLIATKTQTPTPNITPLPTIPTFTPTFDVSTIVTVTPAGKAICPGENTENFSSLNFDVLPNGSGKYVNHSNIDMILNYLNSGGSISNLEKELASINTNFLFQDVTNDGLPDLIIISGLAFQTINILYCDKEKYVIFPKDNIEGEGLGSDQISFLVQDINENNVREVISIGKGKGLEINILEWDNITFSRTELRTNSIGAGSEFQIIDINNDGINEFIISGTPNYWYYPGEPLRFEVNTYVWNGEIFSHSVSFSSPEYRFQAVQDGDNLSIQGDYIEAINLYQETINSNLLDWWSKERFEVERDAAIKFSTPTVLSIDNSEYPQLASYAYYRLFILNLAREKEMDAKATYQTLKAIFEKDPYGFRYVEMATEFLQAYQVNQSIYTGCAAAIQYAAEHPEILIPLGSDYHGSQAKIYKPEDVCPFR